MIKEIYLAAGCFWGAEKYLKLIRGVVYTQVGFANGNTENPSYKQVYTDTTGFAECVKVQFNPAVLDMKKLIRLYFQAIDPLSVNQQGEDKGTRYRTGVYYVDPCDEPRIREVFAEVESACGAPLAVELLPLKNYYSAEEYHQDYLDKNPGGYCHLTPAIFRKAAEGNPEIIPALESYVETQIIPRYESFDKAHRIEHVRAVIDQALAFGRIYELDQNVVYVAAAYHDTGLCEGRERHHVVSARILRADERLLEWLSREQIETAAQAAQDHRASAASEPRTIYGRVIAEADRQIAPLTVVRRTIQYGKSHYPELDKEGHWQRTLEHLHEKYAEGGYLKLWIPESPNAERMKELRELIADERRLRELFDSEFDSL